MPDPVFQRIALYHVPDGPLGNFGADWLGWDARSGTVRESATPDHWTSRARRYGFHATLKAPFRLADGATLAQAAALSEALSQTLRPATIGDLEPRWLGRFLALVPVQPTNAIRDLAAQCVRALEPCRAALSPAEAEKYAARDLPPELQANVNRWGYPHVMDAFRFHLTLTDRLPKADRAAAQAALCLPPERLGYRLSHISLMGEDTGGYFHEIARYALADRPEGSAR
ncbi:DUF1045 domain-containing protein [Marivita sp. GX14005]|uniref:DUF1045 domain-containing protein n=1 Tax=Marivita sp. GX14005 TaxID=2942276 RepID=UPI002018AC42|nr:DUF1045 domain-containing protein [Marivita sp. GX14005]MCL3880796.1 DUF1045 domain-containing protein [Marivita sp. GX14005]